MTRSWVYGLATVGLLAVALWLVAGPFDGRDQEPEPVGPSDLGISASRADTETSTGLRSDGDIEGRFDEPRRPLSAEGTGRAAGDAGPRGQVVLQVVGWDGSPAAGCSVWWVTDDLRRGRPLGEPLAVGGADGRVVIASADSDSDSRQASLLLWSPSGGYGRVTIEPPVTTEAVPLSVQLLRGADVEGSVASRRVEGGHRHAVSVWRGGLRVPSVVDRGDERVWAGMILAVGRNETDASGRFHLRSLPPATILVAIDGTPISAFGYEAVALSSDRTTSLGRIELPMREVGGRVIDGDGAPVVGARVSIQVVGGLPGDAATLATSLRVMSTSTDASGRFEFLDVLDGEYELSIRATGFATLRRSWFPRRDSDHELVLSRGGLAVVTVHGLAPDPEVSLRVTTPESFHDMPWNDEDYSVTRIDPESSLFDAQVFEVRGIGDLGAEVRAVDPEGRRSEPVSIPALAESDVHQVAVFMDSGVRIAGRVVDMDGEAVSAADVQLACQGETRRATLDESGAFAVDLPSADAQLWVTADGFLPTGTEVIDDDAAGTVTDWLIVLDPACVLSGFAVDKAGAPVGGAAVAAKLLTPSKGAAAGERTLGVRVVRSRRLVDDLSVTTALDGRFAFAAVAPGLYGLLADVLASPDELSAVLDAMAVPEGGAATPHSDPVATGLPVAYETWEVGRHSESGRVLALVDRVALFGRITPAGLITQEGSVALIRLGADSMDNSGIRPALAVIDTSGSFLFEGALPGAYHLLARVPGFVDVVSQRVDLADESRSITLELPLGAIEGSVVSESGERVAGVSVEFQRVEGDEAETPVSWGSTGLDEDPSHRTDAGGRFRIGGLMAGTLDLRASGAGWVSGASTIVDVPDQGVAAGVVIHVVEGAQLTVHAPGKVRGARAEPPRGRFVLELTEPESGGTIATHPMDDWTVHWGGLRPGAYVLRLRDLQSDEEAGLWTQAVRLSSGDRQDVRFR